MIIRKATEEDLPQILQIYAQPDMDNGKILPLEDAKQIFRRMHSYPNYYVYAAEQNGGIVGTFALVIMDNMAHMGSKSGIVEDVVVSYEHQGNGIGRQMMEHAFKICKEQECYKVSLSSNKKRENTHKFYESIGFKKHGYSFLMEIE